MLMEKERELVVEYGKKMINEHLTTGTGGNISIYDPETGNMAISPSGIDYFKTKPEDVVIMKLDGTIVEGNRKPSSENGMHRALYLKKPEARACVHTHSMFATVLATLNMPIKSVNYILADTGASEVPVAPYATFGTPELASVVAETIGDCNACLLENHGLITVGKNVDSAFSLARECEFIAEIQWRCLCVGQPNILTDGQMKVVMKRFGTYGQVKEKK